MEIKTHLENWTDFISCAPKNLEIWLCIKIFAPLILAASWGMLTGRDLVIPENLPLKVFKSYLTQACHKKDSLIIDQ